jgi:nicotinamidase-related amidase
MDPLVIFREKTALVVIDLQKGIAAMPTEPHDATSVVRNAAKLAEACRNQGMPVFLVRVTPSADMKDGLRPAADERVAMRGAMAPDWSEIVPEMKPRESDFIITKRQWGAFYGTELDLQLRRRSIDTIILCGIATDIGVESTARFAYEYGYNQIFAEDAVAGRSAEGHRHAVKEIFPRIGKVRTTEQILVALN